MLQNKEVNRAKRTVEYPPRSTDFTSPDFHLWGDLKITVCTRRPRTLQDLSTTLKFPLLLFHQQPCAKYTTLLHVCYQQYLRPGGGDFDICEFKSTNETMG
jgi:hypothetical protein